LNLYPLSNSLPARERGLNLLALDLTILIIKPSYKTLNGFTLIIELSVLKNKTASSLRIADEMSNY
jgi:hypothetical protein